MIHKICNEYFWIRNIMNIIHLFWRRQASVRCSIPHPTLGFPSKPRCYIHLRWRFLSMLYVYLKNIACIIGISSLINLFVHSILLFHFLVFLWFFLWFLFLPFLWLFCISFFCSRIFFFSLPWTLPAQDLTR